MPKKPVKSEYLSVLFPNTPHPFRFSDPDKFLEAVPLTEEELERLLSFGKVHIANGTRIRYVRPTTFDDDDTMY